MGANMKILLVQNMIYVPTFGGANKANRLLLEAFASNGHECMVAAPAISIQVGPKSEQDLLAELTRQGIVPRKHGSITAFHLNNVEVRAVLEVRHLAQQVIRTIEEFNPDCTIVVSDNPGLVLLEAALRSRAHRVIFIARTTTALPFGPDSFIQSTYDARLLRQASGILTVSNYLARYIMRWGGIHATYLPLPVYEWHNIRHARQDDRTFVTMINPSAIKGIAIFLSIAQQLRPYPFAAVPTWGTTQEDRRKLATNPNVHMLAPSEDIDDILSKTAVLLVPSLWAEAFGRICVEGMLRGIPVVASNVGGLPEAKLGVPYVLPVNPIERYEFRLDEQMIPVPVVPEQNTLPWAETITELLFDSELYRQNSTMSREAAIAFCSSLSLSAVEQYIDALAEATRLE